MIKIIIQNVLDRLFSWESDGGGGGYYWLTFCSIQMFEYGMVYARCNTLPYV